MGNDKACLVVTDPPYSVAIESVSKRLEADGRDTILNDNMHDDQFKEFLNEVFSSYAAIMDQCPALDGRVHCFLRHIDNYRYA